MNKHKLFTTRYSRYYNDFDRMFDRSLPAFIIGYLDQYLFEYWSKSLYNLNEYGYVNEQL